MVLTGSYFSHAHVIDMQRRLNTTIDVKFMDRRGKSVGVQRNYRGKKLIGTLTVPLPTLVNTMPKSFSNTNTPL